MWVFVRTGAKSGKYDLLDWVCSSRFKPRQCFLVYIEGWEAEKMGNMDAVFMLEFLKRVVSLGSVGNRMEMVRFGMLDIVIRGVSESSFLEDYENGICVIGILLRSIRDFRNKQDVIDYDFSDNLSHPELESILPPDSLSTTYSSIEDTSVGLSIIQLG
ncbi:hypothetical protein BLNAU_14555 [Blattamonas nauphoetae]|uniref:Uncharacterized protein n=1 Tax=Blattamonas nauphoetae TaxID=2049346 RepID=A0ABQ9XJX8_9EUKA|nr:hypothetical protein BLNAU_14555 [Blattamonas nauphoetae]